ncbi:BCCT family transporter, partial [uncultured Psychrobacter sp.]|uniref:BCCT family transporter n=1 Tax=uncultured Psychrobacter sp. TaxID=259303 RepID=UPI0025963197
IFAWTIAWSPFVGTFIANISRGRTIRQFVLGVLFVPVIFTFFWFAVFGDTALNLIMVEGLDTLIGDVQADKSVALFKLFEALPFTQVASYLTVLLIMTFFVTSSDSGSLVIDSIASGGRPTPPWQRTFWVVIQGVVASVLLLAGGLTALQTVAIVSALPFAIILLISMGGMWRALIIEEHRTDSLAQDNRVPPHLLAPSSWRDRIDYLTKQPAKEEVLVYIKNTVEPAMQEVASKFMDSGWEASAEFDEVNSRANLELKRGDEVDFWYEVRLGQHEIPGYYDDTDNKVTQSHRYRAEVYLRRGGQTYDLYGYQPDAVINDIIDQFEKYLHFLDVSPDSLPWRMEQHDEGLIVESTSEFDKD